MVFYLIIIIFTSFSIVLFKLHSRINIYVVAINLVLFSVLILKFSGIIFKINFFTQLLFFIILIMIVVIILFYLFWSSNKLIQHEGKHWSNYLVLGSAVVIVWLIATLPISFISNDTLAPYLFVSYIFIFILVFYFLVLFISCLLLSLVYSLIKVREPIDIIIVLGSGLINGKVPPLLQSRIDIGYALYQNQHNPYFIMSGGQGSDETIPESIAMKNYLLKKGISDCRIICETKSLNTTQNLKYSKDIILERFPENSNIAICTNNFHLLRALFLAKKLNYKHTYGVGSKTISYFFTNAFLREFIALLKMDIWIHALVFILMIISFVFTLLKI